MRPYWRTIKLLHSLFSVSMWKSNFVWLCSQPSPPSEGSPFTVILLRFNTKMETLIQLKNNPFLMGLCRNCPPPDLQYDTSSGKRRVYLVRFSFVSPPLILCSNANTIIFLLLPELYRISTFARFPSSGVTERSLARAGWFYTGVGDRVQCFKCNVTAEGWQAGDCPTEKHRQLSPSCSFIQSLPSTSNLLSSSHSAFSPLRIAPAIPVRATTGFFVSFFSLDIYFLLNICLLPAAYWCRAGCSQPISKPRRRASWLSEHGLLRSATIKPTYFSWCRGHVPPETNMPQSQHAQRAGSLGLLPLLDAHHHNSCWTRQGRVLLPQPGGQGGLLQLWRAGVYHCKDKVNSRLRFINRRQQSSFRLQLSNWEPGDRAMSEHQRHYSNCRFVRGDRADNIPLAGAVPGGLTSQLSAGVPTLSNPAMQQSEERLLTFVNWPSRIPVRPDQLAKAGFYYVGKGSIY